MLPIFGEELKAQSYCLDPFEPKSRLQSARVSVSTLNPMDLITLRPGS